MAATRILSWFARLRRAPGRVLVVAAGVALAAGCAEPAPGDPATGDSPAAGGTAGGPFASASQVLMHIHGVSVDPADGRVYIASQNGLFRAAGDP